MEQMGAIAEGEWISLSGIYTAEEANFMAQLLSNSSDPSHGNGVFQSSFWPGNDQSLMNMATTSFSPGENFYLSDSNPVLQMDYHVHNEECLNREKSESFENRTSQSEPFREEKNGQIGSSKKRSWNSSESEIQKSKRNVRSKKSQKGGSTSCNEDGNGGFNGQSTSSCCSDDDSNEELTSSSKGKTRANRGSATDPQSLYARKRRERINERLKILQTLVPNGTKVDISTMLEEAVHYVKFLQLQIKLLSSDDLWMYAPIAYNGMDLGLDLKLMTPKQS